ncbi:unnamed protein product [Durusdinium trenchii]|uniref:Uncharacterized protein n=1 Tax=Durusdinium trenchii TaxID=1381693 RepID=A0ABP0NI63_9DINO
MAWFLVFAPQPLPSRSAGYICDVQYSRYLERRSKRIARAAACVATLKLTVGREEAEKDEFQIKVLKALAESLQVPETRLAIQGLSEGRGFVKLNVLLTRPSEDQKGKSCSELWQKLKSELKKVQEGALSCIDSIVVDGDADETTKVYSIWLTPSGKTADVCKKAMAELSSKLDAPSFEPHVTLGEVSGEEQEVLAMVERFARETSTFAVDLETLEVDQSYFSGVYFPARTSDALFAAFDAITSQLPSGWPQWLGGRSCRWRGARTRSDFRAILPMAYVKDLAGAPEVGVAPSEASFTAMQVSVWETDPEDFTCKSWKEVKTFKFEGKKPPSFWRLLWRFSKVAAPEFLQIGLGTALSLVANVVVDWAIQHDSDLFTGKHVGKDTSELVRVLGHGLMIWGAVNQLFTNSRMLMERSGKRIGCRLQEQLFQKLIQQDVKWIQQKGADELYKTLMKRTDNVQRVFTNQIPQLITMASNLVMNIGFLWFSKPRLCAFGIGMFAFQNIGNSVFDNILRLARDHDHKLEEVKENALEVLQNFRTVRAFGREEKEKQSFHSCMAQALRLRFSDVVDKFTDLGCWFVSEFTFQVAYMYGGILVNLNYIKATEVKDAVSKSFRAVWPLYQLRRQLTHQSTFMEDAAAVLEALERPPEIPFGDERMFSPSTEKINGRIEAKGVCFSYSDDLDAAALKEVTFEIPCGSMVGLVGPSGCGKSTLFNLLLRFYDPQKGAIEVDGVDLAKWNPQALYRAVSWVSQDQCVFTGSVIENIRYGMPHATEEEVLQVMREADLYDDVMKKPSGVATAASELSGGQKQRLSIARALLRNPKILLLDEATSALDTVSERKVQKALEKLMKGRTVIAIAHRLSTIMNADLILVMEAGKVIEQGTHTELLKKSGSKYANLVQQQLAVEDKKDDTSADPKVVEECAAQLQLLREKVPEDLVEEVDRAAQALKNAAATLREERKRLAMKERSLLGTTSKWKTAGDSVRRAVRTLALMRSSSEALPRPQAPQLQRRLSANDQDDVDRALLELEQGDSPKAEAAT